MDFGSIRLFGIAAMCAVAVLARRRRRALRESQSFPLVGAAFDDDAASCGPSHQTAAMLAEVLNADLFRPALPQTECVYVTSVEGLGDLQRDLEDSRVFSVDIEHSPRSFHGFVCTIQISVPGRDYVIDTLLPDVRRAVEPLLGRFFSSSRRVKVLHGSSNDVRWLHSNFGIALHQPMIDTAVLAKAIGEPSLSLASLVHRHSTMSIHFNPKRAFAWRKRANQLAEHSKSMHFHLFSCYPA